MLVLNEPGDISTNILAVAVAGVTEGLVGLGTYASYRSAVGRIILRNRGLFEFVPNKLSAAMIGAFKAICGRVTDAIEASYAQWQQYAICAMQAEARRSRTATAKPLAVTPVRAVRRVKSFFVSQKVNGRNAP